MNNGKIISSFEESIFQNKDKDNSMYKNEKEKKENYGIHFGQEKEIINAFKFNYYI